MRPSEVTRTPPGPPTSDGVCALTAFSLLHTTCSIQMALLTLPPELLNIIIPLSIPAPSRADVATRTSTLGALSLVSSTWRVYAQYRLFAHLRLKERHLRALEAESRLGAKEGPARTKAGEVKSLVVEKWIDDYGTGVKRSLSAFSEVEEVWLEGTKEWSSLTTIAVLPSASLRSFSPWTALTLG